MSDIKAVNMISYVAIFINHQLSQGPLNIKVKSLNKSGNHSKKNMLAQNFNEPDFR